MRGGVTILVVVSGGSIKADAKFKMSEITPKVKVARCKIP